MDRMSEKCLNHFALFNGSVVLIMAATLHMGIIAGERFMTLLPNFHGIGVNIDFHPLGWVLWPASRFVCAILSVQPPHNPKLTTQKS